MIYARFTPALKNVTTNPVTQWDYGRTLRIEGLELPTAIRIDFGVSGGQTTVSRIGITKDRVTDVVIPDSFLEQSNGIVAYVYVSDTTEGKTVRTINIPVKARAKPEEYDSPESKELFAEAIKLINDVAVRAENAEAEAKTHADSAKASLEATEQIAEAFTGTAENAVNAVNSAGAAQVQKIGNKGIDAVADVEAQKQTSIAAVKAEGETQLQAITEETAQIVADRERINSNYHNKAGAIVLDAEGESVVVNDASEYPLQNLKVFGRSTQDGTPTPDAPVDIVSVANPVVTVDEQTLAIPHTLHGIPVSSGGNYTDADGQQWTCDEVDLERGVYVQRVSERTLIGRDTEDWGMTDPGTFRCHSIHTEILCKQFESVRNEQIKGNYEANQMLSDGQCALRYGSANDRTYFKWSNITTLAEWLSWLSNNPLTIQYVLTTPIETPLSEAEINAFRAMHTNKPNTTVLNDAGAYMSVEYVADTKTYIDRQISTLLSKTDET